MRKYEVLSITTAPALAARGACTAETLAPGEHSTMSMPLKSNLASSRTFRIAVLAERDLACRPTWPDASAHHLVGREIPLRQGLQHFAADIAGRADDRDSIAHGTVRV